MDYLETTIIILLLLLIFSIFSNILSYVFVSFRKKESLCSFSSKSPLLFPTLIIGPISLVIGFQIFKINLIFPVHFFVGRMELIKSSIIPSLILLVSSGLLTMTYQTVSREYFFWKSKPFSLAIESLGRSPRKELFSLVFLKSLTESWSYSLPWIFGELIIVEAVFNAPGLGYNAWNLAKQRDFYGLIFILIYLSIIYFLFFGASFLLNRWLGKRLESYV